MIFKEGLGAVQRFVGEYPDLPEELRTRPAELDSWSALAGYLGDLHDALDALDKAAGKPNERGGGLFEFYDRGLARVREYARSQT